MKTLGSPNDLKIRYIVLSNGANAAVLYLSTLTDKKFISDNIIEPLCHMDLNDEEYSHLGRAAGRCISAGEITTLNSITGIIDSILTGQVAVIFDGASDTLVIDARKFSIRSISEPNNEMVLRGPREGFTEDLNTNISMLRRKIRNSSLRIDIKEMGKPNKTNIAIFYLENKVSHSMLDELHKRISGIDSDEILETSYIEEWIEDTRLSLFPTIDHTEKVDSLASAIMEGRIGVMVDGSPFALKIPTFFFDFFQSSEDYYVRYPIGNFSRWLRLISLLISLILPGLYVAIVNFHHEMLPPTALMTIASAREGIPFSTLAEALIMELIYEGVREAGVRMPRATGQAMSILGALIIGEAAIQARIVSAPMVIILAGTGIASFIIPHAEISDTLKILRFLSILAAGIGGLFGLLMLFLVIHVHLLSLTSFGLPYYLPLQPLDPSGIMDILARMPAWFKRRKMNIDKDMGKK